MNTNPSPGTSVYNETGLPELGSSVITGILSWRGGRLRRRRPKPIKVLGEDVVLFRDKNQIFALKDQCAHRGARLSKGSCLYTGTGTWTCP